MFLTQLLFSASICHFSDFLNICHAGISGHLPLEFTGWPILVPTLNFDDQLKKIIKSYKRVGYNTDIMRQSACLVVNSITVNCTTVVQASDLMTALT